MDSEIVAGVVGLFFLATLVQVFRWLTVSIKLMKTQILWTELRIEDGG